MVKITFFEELEIRLIHKKPSKIGKIYLKDLQKLDKLEEELGKIRSKSITFQNLSPRQSARKKFSLLQKELKILRKGASIELKYDADGQLFHNETQKC